MCVGFYYKTSSETVTTRKLILPKVDLKVDLSGFFLNFAKGKTDYIISPTKHKKVSRSEKQQ